MTLESDEDTRGIGVLLRFAGVTMPAALFSLVFGWLMATIVGQAYGY